MSKKFSFLFCHFLITCRHDYIVSYSYNHSTALTAKLLNKTFFFLFYELRLSRFNSTLQLHCLLQRKCGIASQWGRESLFDQFFALVQLIFISISLVFSFNSQQNIIFVHIYLFCIHNIRPTKFSVISIVGKEWAKTRRKS